MSFSSKVNDIFSSIHVNVIIVVSIAALLVTAFFIQRIDILEGILLGLFASLTAISFNSLYQSVVTRHDAIGVERSLPSLDGSIGGWRFTHSLTMLLVTCVFAIPTLLLFYEIQANNRINMSHRAADTTNILKQSAVTTKKDQAKKSALPDSLKYNPGITMLPGKTDSIFRK